MAREVKYIYHHHHPNSQTETSRSQLQITGPSNPNGGYTQSKGALQMIQKARPTNRVQKLITRQVNMAVLAPSPTVEYLNWSNQPIGFDRGDHPPQGAEARPLCAGYSSTDCRI
jgi:hypothetical protein